MPSPIRASARLKSARLPRKRHADAQVARQWIVTSVKPPKRASVVKKNVASTTKKQNARPVKSPKSVSEAKKLRALARQPVSRSKPTKRKHRAIAVAPAVRPLHRGRRLVLEPRSSADVLPSSMR